MQSDAVTVRGTLLACHKGRNQGGDLMKFHVSLEFDLNVPGNTCITLEFDLEALVVAYFVFFQQLFSWVAFLYGCAERPIFFKLSNPAFVSLI
jgi:hypothetical protein